MPFKEIDITIGVSGNAVTVESVAGHAKRRDDPGARDVRADGTETERPRSKKGSRMWRTG